MPENEKVIFLRRLILEEVFRKNFEPFLVTSIDFYEKEAQKFQEPGFYDSELGNCIPLAMSNILLVPIVIFNLHGKLPCYSRNSQRSHTV